MLVCQLWELQGSAGIWIFNFTLRRVITLSGLVRRINLGVRVSEWFFFFFAFALVCRACFKSDVSKNVPLHPPPPPPSCLPETISSRRRRGDEVKNYSPWLSEMEQSVGWSRLVCSRQWRVKEITPSLCQQPWPCTHKNIMRKDMLGLQGRKKKKKEGGLSLEHSSQAATGGKQLFACCSTSQGQWVRLLRSTALDGVAAECRRVTSWHRSPANTNNCSRSRLWVQTPGSVAGLSDSSFTVGTERSRSHWRRRNREEMAGSCVRASAGQSACFILFFSPFFPFPVLFSDNWGLTCCCSVEGQSKGKVMTPSST